MRTILGVVYLVVGVLVASANHYFGNLSAIKPIASAILAVVLWPLILIGVNLHL